MLVACSAEPTTSTPTTSASPDGAATAAVAAGLPAAITSVMNKPRYADATWSLLVTDVDTGESFYELNADEMSLTGSTRKLFSVGAALDALGADHRQITPVYRQGTVGSDGTLDGNLILVGGGDLEFGGRRIDADTVEYTDVDHNDANQLGSAFLTPQDPLFAVNELAQQVKDAGITAVSGDVVIDDRMFDPYRVPNGNLLITPVLLNENHVDVTVTPGEVGQRATVVSRPQTAALTVDGTVMTVPAGSPSTVTTTAEPPPTCIGTPGCTATVSGEIAADYQGPLTGSNSFVGTFRVEEPTALMRTAFIEALVRVGVTVTAPAVAANAAALSPTVLPGAYPADTLVASHESAPFAQTAQLVLKVSLNLGANLSLSLLGLTAGQKSVQGALDAERKILTETYGIDGSQFSFPTNGSGTPDSAAAPRALVQMLIAMSTTEVAQQYRDALPVLGEDGSLATTGLDLAGRGHVFAKPGTTIGAAADGQGLALKAQNLSGYIETKSGRTVAYALMVNDAGPIGEATLTTDVGEVFEDEAVISSAIYDLL